MTHILDEFERNHAVIHRLVDTLQENFKQETRYPRPLLPPQANILFALDAQGAGSMISYMSQKLRDACGFGPDEFRFVRRGGSESGGLLRVRLEFTRGVTRAVIGKLAAAMPTLEQGTRCA